MRPPAGSRTGGRGGTTRRRQGSLARRRRGPGVCEAARQPTPAGAEHWMNKPAESTRFRVEAAREAAILRGDIRDDLIRDEVLADLFAATARARPDHRRPHLRRDAPQLWRGRRAQRCHCPRPDRARHRPGRRRRAVDGPRRRAPDRPDRDRQVRRRLAALRCRRAGRPHRDLPRRRRRQGACHRARRSSPQAAGRLPGRRPRRARPDRRPRAARSAGARAQRPITRPISSTPRARPARRRASSSPIATSATSCAPRTRSTASAPTTWCFQGASVAFDLSMEEIWIPYMVGATLFVASPAMIGDVETPARHPRCGRRHRARHGADAARAARPRQSPRVRLILARRRGAAAAARRALGEARPAALQHLRPDRSDGRRDRLRSCARASP